MSRVIAGSIDEGETTNMHIQLHDVMSERAHLPVAQFHHQIFLHINSIRKCAPVHAQRAEHPDECV